LFSKYSNNTEWNGLIGAIIKKEADVAVAALTITPERAEVIAFSVPFLETGITIVVAIREGAISPTAFLGKDFILCIILY
jgi:ABC-type amino acid transport substrate-binding protein